MELILHLTNSFGLISHKVVEKELKFVIYKKHGDNVKEVCEQSSLLQSTEHPQT